MSERPYLLLCNDDGVQAQGLKHLWLSVKDHADVIIVAPSSEKSGCGLSTTWITPVIAREVEGVCEAWSVDGTPSDCIKMALGVLLKRKPSMVLSGINAGSNAGSTVLYSGTVGAIIEATIKEVPGIAFSYTDFEVPSSKGAEKWVYPIVEHFLKNPLPKGTFLNINFPPNHNESVKGFKLTRQGRSYWKESPEKRKNPHGTDYYWLGGKWSYAPDELDDSDVYWNEKGFITGVPIRIRDLTDHEALIKEKSKVETHFSSSFL
jgi:5'-nucleotidase